MSRAVAHGVVRVIVQLRTPEGSDTSLVESVKRALLADLDATPHRVVRRLDGLPLIALEASADALAALDASTHVLRVTEDTPSRLPR